MFNTVRGVYVAPEQRAQLSPSFAALIKRCLQREPRDRFPSCQEVTQKLESLMKGSGDPRGVIRTALSRPVGSSASLALVTGQRRPRWLLGAIAGGILALAIGGLTLIPKVAAGPEQVPVLPVVESIPARQPPPRSVATQQPEAEPEGLGLKIEPLPVAPSRPLELRPDESGKSAQRVPTRPRARPVVATATAATPQPEGLSIGKLRSELARLRGRMAKQTLAGKPTDPLANGFLSQVELLLSQTDSSPQALEKANQLLQSVNSSYVH